MKKALVILLALTMVMSMVAVVPFGTAAEEELAIGQVAADYKPEGTAINTAEDFANMEATGSYYLAADITISESCPVFSGTFDGNGKTITTSVPVFDTFDGVLKNLTTKGAVTVEDETGSEAEKFAGVVARVVGNTANTEITNVCNMAPITSANLAIGGVVGMVSNDEQYEITFTDVVNYGNITASNSSTSYDCGGIAGQFDGDNGVENHYVKFINCQNYGTINACGRPGGIIGYANASTAFIDCYNAGAIQATANYCGGIAGRLDGDKGYNYFLLENCVNDGKVIVYKSQGAGMVGYCGGFQELIYKNCVNNGEVVGDAGNVVGITLGGIHGNNNENAKNLVFENCINNGVIGDYTWAQSMNAGGIAGGTRATNVTFTGCVNNGEIRGTNNIGGIAGSANGGNTADKLAWVTVTKCVNNGDVTQKQYAAGKGYVAAIVGYSYQGNTYGPTFTYNVNTANVKSDLLAAGLIGYMNCGYYDSVIEYNIIGGSIQGQEATTIASGDSVTNRVLYTFTDANGVAQYFYAPEVGTVSIVNDVVTFTPDAAITTVKEIANGAEAAKNDICKFQGNDGNWYAALVVTKGAITIDTENNTVTDSAGVTMMGVEIPADFDGTSIVLNTYDYAIDSMAICWSNNSSFPVDMSKNVVLEGAADIDYIMGFNNKWQYIGNTAETVSARVSEADMISGKVAYDLNQAIGEVIFYQNVNADLFEVDAYPTTDSTHGKVIASAGGYNNQLLSEDDSATPATGDATIYVVVALAVSTISLAAVAVCKKQKEN